MQCSMLHWEGEEAAKSNGRKQNKVQWERDLKRGKCCQLLGSCLIILSFFYITNKIIITTLICNITYPPGSGRGSNEWVGVWGHAMLLATAPRPLSLPPSAT